MRLINTDTLIMHEFLDMISSGPPYAILSHTWGPEEITYQDWLYVTKQNPARWGWVYLEDEINKIEGKKGYAKIRGACRQARQNGLDWVWVDTCCIDKTNSSELSEAINSMYDWYKNAKQCYVYLADVSSSYIDDCEAEHSEFRNSRWFKRGWTLQELLAPSNMTFFTSAWKYFCHRDQMADTLQEITKIPQIYLSLGSFEDVVDRDRLSTAEIMSWTAERETTRIEDEAYCLLGLFGINMPLLYGEGEKAFLRLQLEISQRTLDLSFLAWQALRDGRHILPRGSTELCPAFSSRHWFFAGAEDSGYKTAMPYVDTKPMSVTNLGLSLPLRLVDTLDPDLKFGIIIPLSETDRSVWIPLLRNGARYYRIGLVSFTLMVPLPLPDMALGDVMRHFFGDQDVILPIYQKPGNVYRNTVDLSPLRRPSNYNILLAFHTGNSGLRDYRVSCRLRQTDGLEEYALPQHTRLRWEDLLLELQIDEIDMNYAYGAIEFQAVEEKPGFHKTLETTMTRIAILFVAKLNETGTPITWTCADITGDVTSPTAAGDPYLLARQTALGVRAAKKKGPSSWEQVCILEPWGRQPGYVRMDDLERDLLSPEFGGYGQTMTALKSGEDANSFKEGGSYPILAQVMFPGTDWKSKS